MYILDSSLKRGKDVCKEIKLEIAPGRENSEERKHELIEMKKVSKKRKLSKKERKENRANHPCANSRSK
jgi:hypothetical protein